MKMIWKKLPLDDGLDSVSWLPSLKEQKSEDMSTVREGAEILPLFPLGGIVYTPNSEHVLNIFEPRYRKMYTDILMNGSKRFVVSMSHPEKDGTFAEIGVIFYLDDLKEVSEQTGDKVKYICNHKVTGRVKLHRILNAEDWETRDTYLKVEGTILEDVDANNVQIAAVDENEAKDEKINDIYASLMAAATPIPSMTQEERFLSKSFGDLVNKQHELEEDVRFTRASVSTLAVAPGDGEDGLWMTIRLWQSFIEQRMVAAQNEMQREFQAKLIEFLKKEKGVDEKELPSAIGFDDLSPSLQQDVQDLQKRMVTELRPLVLENTLTIQKILEADGHTSRVKLLQYFVDAEKKRLEAKNTLRGMFQGTLTSLDEPSASEDTVVPKSITDGGVSEATSAPNSIIMDEPDAFQ